MAKLVLQLFVACALWFGLGALGAAAGWRIGAIVCGVIAVHQVWERFVFNPYLYLGAMPVSDDDPIMLQAREEGKKTLPQFLAIYPEHNQDSIVKFRFTTDTGRNEYLWADLMEVSEGKATVYVRTFPISNEGEFNRKQEIQLDEIVDWQVEYRDGSLRGGYTTRALMKIFERQEGYMHPKLRGQLERFKELER
jgi:uncharacterized protein YegJ (DUF2314 family)